MALNLFLKMLLFMNVTFKSVLQDKIAYWGLIISSIFLLLQIISLGIFYLSLPPVLPVFNQLPWGEKRLGSKPEIFIPIVLTIIFLSINFVISARLYEKTPLLARMLSITTLLISLLSFVFIVRTVYLLI